MSELSHRWPLSVFCKLEPRRDRSVLPSDAPARGSDGWGRVVMPQRLSHRHRPEARDAMRSWQEREGEGLLLPLQTTLGAIRAHALGLR